MAIKKIKDEYPQFMRLSVTMSAADTLTFGILTLGNVLFEYAGIVITRTELYIDRSVIALMTADQDRIICALTGSNTLTSLGTNLSEVYDYFEISRNDLGAAANNTVHLRVSPIIHNYTGLQGGGILVPFKDMYIGLTSNGLASAAAATLRVYYRLVELKAADFLEITQRLNVLST